MIRICHFSDWHGQNLQLPDADLYICTGDIYPNYVDISWYSEKLGKTIMLPGDQSVDGSYDYVGRHIDPQKECREQRKWTKKQRSYRKFFGPNSTDAPVIVVRGNHDFTDLAPLFGGEVYELGDPRKVVELLGYRFGGTRGIPRIHGEWSDERTDDRLREDADQIPTDIDVLVTHCPPKGIMDYPQDGIHVGNASLATYITRASYAENPKLKLHCFGHIHETHGVKDIAGILFSNAATTFQVINLP